MTPHNTAMRITCCTSRTPGTASLLVAWDKVRTMDIVRCDAIWGLVCITGTIGIATNMGDCQPVSIILVNGMLTSQDNTILYLAIVDRMGISVHNAHLILISLSVGEHRVEPHTTQRGTWSADCVRRIQSKCFRTLVSSEKTFCVHSSKIR